MATITRFNDRVKLETPIQVSEPVDGYRTYTELEWAHYRLLGLLLARQ